MYKRRKKNKQEQQKIFIAVEFLALLTVKISQLSTHEWCDIKIEWIKETESGECGKSHGLKLLFCEWKQNASLNVFDGKVRWVEGRILNLWDALEFEWAKQEIFLLIWQFSNFLLYFLKTNLIQCKNPVPISIHKPSTFLTTDKTSFKLSENHVET